MAPFGLAPRHWDIVERELIAPLSAAGAKVWVFGSRARGDHREFSDLDVLVGNLGDRKLLARCAEALEESLLPVRVDLVLEDDLAASYREGVLRDRIKV